MFQHKEQRPTTSAEWERKAILHHKVAKTDQSGWTERDCNLCGGKHYNRKKECRYTCKQCHIRASHRTSECRGGRKRNWDSNHEKKYRRSKSQERFSSNRTFERRGTPGIKIIDNGQFRPWAVGIPFRSTLVGISFQCNSLGIIFLNISVGISFQKTWLGISVPRNIIENINEYVPKKACICVLHCVKLSVSQWLIQARRK